MLAAHASSRLRRLRAVSGTAGCCGGKRWREESAKGRVWGMMRMLNVVGTSETTREHRTTSSPRESGRSVAVAHPQRRSAAREPQTGNFPQTEGKPRRKVATGTPRRRGLDPQRRRARRDGRQGRVAHHIVLLRNGLSRCPRDLCAAIRGQQRRADALFSTNQTLVFAGRVFIPRYLSNHAAIRVSNFYF